MLSVAALYIGTNISYSIDMRCPCATPVAQRTRRAVPTSACSSAITFFVTAMERTNGTGMVIPMMATALAKGDFLQKKPIPPPGA